MSQTTTAIYLFIGLSSERESTPLRPWPHSNAGFMGVVDKCDDMAVLVEAWYAKAEELHPDFDCPGVFDYEITEEMGGWLYNNFNCTNAEFVAELDLLFARWITGSVTYCEQLEAR